MPKVSHTGFPGIVFDGVDSGSVSSEGGRPPLPIGLHPQGFSDLVEILGNLGNIQLPISVRPEILHLWQVPRCCRAAGPAWFESAFCFLAVVTGYNGNRVRYAAVHTGKPCCSECFRLAWPLFVGSCKLAAIDFDFSTFHTTLILFLSSCVISMVLKSLVLSICCSGFVQWDFRFGLFWLIIIFSLYSKIPTRKITIWNSLAPNNLFPYFGAITGII